MLLAVLRTEEEELVEGMAEYIGFGLEVVLESRLGLGLKGRLCGLCEL